MTDLLIKLKKPFEFEGEEYTEIDLTALENITGLDLIKAKRQYAAAGGTAMVASTDMEYCLMVAAVGTKKPIEFFQSLSGPVMNKVYMRVMGFLMSESDED